MRKLYFGSRVGSDGSLEGVWSGTVFSLYHALAKQYDIHHINTGLKGHGLFSFPLRVANQIINDMDLLQEKVLRNYCTVPCDVPVFSFDETIWNQKNNLQYIYIDLAVSNLNDFRYNQPDIFKVSGFQRFSINKMKRRERYQNRFFHHVAHIFTMGHWLEKDLIEREKVAAKKIIHVGGGCNVDISKIDNISCKSGNKILFIGRDFERKNGQLVLEAFRILHERKPNSKLYMAGFDNPGIDEEGIKIVGDVDYSHIVKLYNRCDIFCMLSLFEAYGLVFPEALIFGLPCIGRDAFEMPYFINDGENGLLLHQQDKYELAELMESALQNTKMKENVYSRQSEYIKEYSWENVAKRISKVIDEDIKNNQRKRL